MLICSVIKNEAERNEQMIKEYERLISSLPKGSLICRESGYYYLKYRENGKLYDQYIGKDKENVSDLKQKLELRQHYKRMLIALKQEQRTICKLLEELT